jgi:hypothetical protein
VGAASSEKIGDDGRGGLDGHTYRLPVRNIPDELVIAFAGLEAQFTLLQGRTPTADDFEAVGDADRTKIMFYTKVLAVEDGRDVGEILQAAQCTARDLVLDRRRQVEQIARALLRQGRLTDDDLDAMLGPMTVHNEMNADEYDAMMKDKIAALRAKGITVASSQWD